MFDFIPLMCHRLQSVCHRNGNHVNGNEQQMVLLNATRKPEEKKKLKNYLKSTGVST